MLNVVLNCRVSLIGDDTAGIDIGALGVCSIEFDEASGLLGFLIDTARLIYSSIMKYFFGGFGFNETKCLYG